MVGGNSTPVSRYALVIRSTAPWVRIGPMPGSKPDRKSTRLNSSHVENSYAVFCLKKKKGRGEDDMRKSPLLGGGQCRPQATSTNERLARAPAGHLGQVRMKHRLYWHTRHADRMPG